MSNTTTMTHEQLVQEVYNLQDQYARMKKMYEDLFYNLDYDSFSSNLQSDMKDFKLTFSEVFPDGSKGESAIIANASKITGNVKKIAETIGGRIETSGELTLTDKDFNTKIFESKTETNEKGEEISLAKYLSQIAQTANKIFLLVEDDASATSLTLQPTFATLVSGSINLKGYVTFSALSKEGGMGETKIHGGNIQAETMTATAIKAESISWDKLKIQYDWTPPEVRPYSIEGFEQNLKNFALSTGADIGKFYDIFRKFGFIKD